MREARRSRYRRNRSSSGKGEQPGTINDSPVSQAFSQYKDHLDKKHDKHEALVKISRDVTIESKRIIFLLHRCVGGDKETLLADAENMISKCVTVHLENMAKELEGADQYLHARAVTAGLQEFVEAYTFYIYIKDSSLPTLEQVRNKLKFTSDTQAECSATDVIRNIQVPLSQMDYILGIADLTGELMRMSINSIGWGDMSLPVQLCAVLQHLQMSFHTYCSNVRGEMERKIQTLKQSVAKVENACYTVKVRGSELPKHVLVHSVQTNNGKPLRGDDSFTEFD